MSIIDNKAAKQLKQDIFTGQLTNYGLIDTHYKIGRLSFARINYKMKLAAMIASDTRKGKTWA